MLEKRAREIVSKFSDKRVLVIGDSMIDHYVYGKVERLNPEAPVPILEAKREEHRTGGAGNTAKNLALLGADTTLISVSGNDSSAEALHDLGIKEGYQPLLIRDPSRPTIRKIRYIVGSQQMLRVDFEEVKDVTNEVQDELIAAIEEAAEKKLDAILISDYAKGVITKRVAECIMSVSKKKNISVTADIKPSHASYFVGVTCISPNVKEAHEILGFNQHEKGGRKPEDLARALSKKMNCDVYLTLGAGGVYVLTQDGTEKHIPQEHVIEVFDVSGAGDTMAALLSLARTCGATPEEAAQLGNAGGAVVVGKIGSVGLTQDELLDMIAHKHE